MFPFLCKNYLIIKTNPIRYQIQIITPTHSWEFMLSNFLLPITHYPLPITYLQIILAQSANEAAKETAEQTKQIITEITTWKLSQGLIVIAISYISIQVVDKLVIWMSEKVAKEWRLRVKQFLPFLRMMVLTFTIILLMNLFLNLSRDNLVAVTGTVAVALGFAFKDYASSIIAGIVGLFEAPYRVGDFPSETLR